MNDNNSLAHTSWNCKYHIVFAPKYRRKVFYGQNRVEIGKIIRELCNWKGVHIIEAEVCPDHIHMLVEIPPKMSIAGFMGFLKGKSSIIIHQRYGNLKYKYGRIFLLLLRNVLFILKGEDTVVPVVSALLKIIRFFLVITV